MPSNGGRGVSTNQRNFVYRRRSDITISRYYGWKMSTSAGSINAKRGGEARPAGFGAAPNGLSAFFEPQCDCVTSLSMTGDRRAVRFDGAETDRALLYLFFFNQSTIRWGARFASYATPLLHVIILLSPRCDSRAYIYAARNMRDARSSRKRDRSCLTKTRQAVDDRAPVTKSFVNEALLPPSIPTAMRFLGI